MCLFMSESAEIDEEEAQRSNWEKTREENKIIKGKEKEEGSVKEKGE